MNLSIKLICEPRLGIFCIFPFSRGLDRKIYIVVTLIFFIESCLTIDKGRVKLLLKYRFFKKKET